MSHFKMISHLNLFTQKRVLLRITKQGSRSKKQILRPSCPIKKPTSEPKSDVAIKISEIKIKVFDFLKLKKKEKPSHVEKNEINSELY